MQLYRVRRRRRRRRRLLAFSHRPFLIMAGKRQAKGQGKDRRKAKIGFELDRVLSSSLHT
jgi:hypothetical protein